MQKSINELTTGVENKQRNLRWKNKAMSISKTKEQYEEQALEPMRKRHK